MPTELLSCPHHLRSVRMERVFARKMRFKRKIRFKRRVLCFFDAQARDWEKLDGYDALICDIV